MRERIAIYGLLMALLAVSVSGCAVFEAESNAQRLVAFQAQATAFVNTASDLREEGRLTDEEMRDLDPIVQRLDQAIDAAWTAESLGEQETVADKIQVIKDLIRQIRPILQEARTDG